MPIPVSTTTPPPVPVQVTPPGGAPVVTPRVPGWRLQVSRGADVVAFNLPYSGVKWALLDGAQGTDLPPVTVFADPLPDSDGSTFRGARFGDRELFFPVRVEDTNYSTMRERVAMLHRMVGDLSPVRLTIRQPSGNARHIDAYYVTGAEGSYAPGDYGGHWRTFGLTFRALDPWWMGDDLTESWRLDLSLARPFLSATEAFFPVVLGDSVVAGARTIRNPGEVTTWPVTRVTGPGDSLVVTNSTTGDSFSLTGTILAGETVTFDHRPGVTDVYDDSGDLWDRVPLSAKFWGLIPGANQIQVTLQNATAASAVAMDWSPRYRTGH